MAIRIIKNNRVIVGFTIIRRFWVMQVFMVIKVGGDKILFTRVIRVIRIKVIRIIKIIEVSLE